MGKIRGASRGGNNRYRRKDNGARNQGKQRQSRPKRRNIACNVWSNGWSYGVPRCRCSNKSGGMQHPSRPKARSCTLRVSLPSIQNGSFLNSKPPAVRSQTSRKGLLEKQGFLFHRWTSSGDFATILDNANSLRRKQRVALSLVSKLAGEIFVSIFGACKPDATNWPTSAVADAGRVQLGRQRAPKYQTGKFKKPYVRVANVYEDRIDTTDILSMDFNERDFRDYRLEFGDILLNEGQSTELVGRPAMWRSEIENCCFQNTLIRFQADPERVIPEFALGLFLQYFRTGEFSKISSKTSSVAHLGAGRFGLMPFPVPPLSLQKQFAERMEQIKKLKEVRHIEASLFESLFSSLQSRAFSGQL